MGDSANDFMGVFSETSGLTNKHCRIVLPTAPTRPVSCNEGEVMNSWFDIYNYNCKKSDQLDEIRKNLSIPDLDVSSDILLKIIEEERLKLPN